MSADSEAHRFGDAAAVGAVLAGELRDSFDRFQTEFRTISRRAQRRWLDADWKGHAADVVERLEVHKQAVNRAVSRATMRLDNLDLAARRQIWTESRQHFAELIEARPDTELAETFFNSVARRLFTIDGSDLDLEFRWLGGIVLPDPAGGDTRCFRRTGTTAELVAEILSATPLADTLDDIGGDSALCAQSIDAHLEETWETWQQGTPFEVDVLAPLFYRNGRAYIVGRVRHLKRISPLVLVLHRTRTGTRVDAALLYENHVSRVFGFTRAYFHVEAKNPARLVSFIKSIVPTKPVAELYTALGYSHHGKTQLVRALHRTLDHSSDQFVFAPGAEGMVMTVFTLPSFDVVFKVMKDRFDPPKRCTHQQVVDKYRLVFEHDRVGRMVDAQEFRNFVLPRSRFATDVLEKLLDVAGSTIEVRGDDVLVKHLFTERRVHPLDTYLRTADHGRAAAAALDYGQAVKDLAAAGIFPGDLFPKNFGVTRHGAVVFYDYDEIQLVTETNFRAIPAARTPEEEMSAQAWFSADHDDVFPEEFTHYLRFQPEIQKIFNEEHGDLSTVDFWQTMQRRVQLDGPRRFFPYPSRVRLHRKTAAVATDV